MRSRLFIVRLFLFGGGLLAILGFVLWFAFPIKLTFPPFLPTGLLAMAYGLACLKQRPQSTAKKNKVLKA